MWSFRFILKFRKKNRTKKRIKKRMKKRIKKKKEKVFTCYLQKPLNRLKPNENYSL